MFILNYNNTHNVYKYVYVLDNENNKSSFILYIIFYIYDQNVLDGQTVRRTT